MIYGYLRNRLFILINKIMKGISNGPDFIADLVIPETNVGHVKCVIQYIQYLSAGIHQYFNNFHLQTGDVTIEVTGRTTNNII